MDPEADVGPDNQTESLNVAGSSVIQWIFQNNYVKRPRT